jgi:phage gpG-like protein
MLATLSRHDELAQQLAALPANLAARLEAKARNLAEALAAKIRDEKLSGQALETKSGALKASIVADVTVDHGEILATVGSVGDVKYAAIQEYGGRTSAHEILPDKTQALAFLVGGVLRFARRVEHPGSTLPARAYLSSSLAESRDEIVAEFASAATQAWTNR